jgi:predicted amidohydrolase
MRAGFLQFSPLFGDVKQNVEKAVSMILAQQADLIVLPELFSTGYQFIAKEEVVDLSEPVPSGPTTQRLTALSKEKNCYIVAGIAERDGDAVFNSAILTGPEGFLGVYRKMHLFYEETLWFSSGDTGLRVWKTPIGNIGIMICFDWFFPMVTRCIENRVFAITANRTGSEMRGDKEELKFIGMSEIVTPKGRILTRAGSEDETCMIVEIMVKEARNKNINQYNNIFDDRQKDFYDS